MYEYRDGILTKTGFLEDGFGIDPTGCGCTDCIVGESFNVGDSRIGTAIDHRRTLYNRSGGEVILPNGYRLDDGGTWRAGNRVPTGVHDCPCCQCDPHGITGF